MRDHRSLSGSNSRPRTPPTTSYNKGGRETSPAARGQVGAASPPRRTYDDYLSHTNNDWNAEDEDDEEDEYGYDNDDGDDFGLPSISSMKRKQKRAAEQNATNPGGGFRSRGIGSTNNSAGLGTRRLSNSADIAIERPIGYPIAKKSEGKILRPQYKEILKGLLPTTRYLQPWLTLARSCKLVALDRSLASPGRCKSKGG